MTPARSDPAAVAALAALVVVVHRRTLQDPVRLRYAGRPVSVTVDGGEASVAAVADRVGRALWAQPGRTGAAAGPRRPLEVDVELEVPTAGRRRVQRVALVVRCGAEPAVRAGPDLAGPDLASPDLAGGVAAGGCGQPGGCAAIVAELTRQLRQALAAAAADPRCPVSRLDLADAADRALVARWGSGPPAAEPACVHDLVAAQARRTPDALAVTGPDGRLTYQELHAAASRLADRVAARLLPDQPDQVVAVLTGRSVAAVVTLLAVLQAGAGYLALDPELPPARLRQLLADARPRLLLAPAELAGLVPLGLAAVLDPAAADPGRTDSASVPAGAGGHTGAGRGHDGPAGGPPPRRRARPGDLAYVSYTSGSTGEPKGVCVPHSAVSRLVRDPDWARFGPGEVVLQLAPLAFDASTLELWGPLAAGGRLAVHPPGPVNPDRLAGTLRDEGVTVLWLTAGLFHRVAADHPVALRGVRQLLTGGDVVSPAAVAAVLAACPGLAVTNGYGPTENTTFTTTWTAPPAAEFDPAGPLPIGRPIRGSGVAVLDPAGRPVPPGVVGELHATGAGLACGYLNRPADTARVFVADPAVSGGRRYRTGDLACWRPDGTLDFVGRRDGQLKVRGHRVEPGEVEEALRWHGGVREAVVVGQPDASGDRRLLAYVVAGGPGLDTARLLRELRARLPAYLVPWAVVPLPALPLTANGKLDRDALPAATRVPRDLPTPYLPPEPGLPARLAQLWGEVLGVEPVGAADGFFDLGGHSLLAAELVGRIRRELRVDLPMDAVHLHPTVADLAAAIPGGGAVTKTTTRPTLTEGERAFVERIGQHYAADGFPLDSGRVLGWMIISDTPEQSASQIAGRLGVSRETVDAVADQLVPATLLQRQEAADGDYLLSLRDDSWPRVVSHTFAGWPRLHQILQDGVAALADEPAQRRARVENMERLFAYLAVEMPAMLDRWTSANSADRSNSASKANSADPR